MNILFCCSIKNVLILVSKNELSIGFFENLSSTSQGMVRHWMNEFTRYFNLEIKYVLKKRLNDFFTQLVHNSQTVYILNVFDVRHYRNYMKKVFRKSLPNAL